MAAALIAALFAMGVFAPQGAGAAVKGGSVKPTVEYSSHAPGADPVTLEATFQINDEIDAAGGNDDVVVALPASIAGNSNFDADDDISLTQGGMDVGSVTHADNGGGADTITISVPASDSSNGNVMRDMPIMLVVTNLMIPSTVTATNEVTTILQNVAGTAESAVDGTTSFAMAYYRSVTSGMATVNNGVAGRPVTLRLRFAADAGSTFTDSDADGAFNVATEAADGTAVTITLPAQYDLDSDGPYTVNGCDDRLASCTETDDTGTDTGGTVSATSPSSVKTWANTNTTILVTDFTKAVAEGGITVTVTGVTNPSTSIALPVKFWQGTGPKGEAESATNPALSDTVDVTDAMQVAVDVTGEGFGLSDSKANAEGVTLTLGFESVVDINDDMTAIEVDLHDSFGGVDVDEPAFGLMVMQDQNGDGVAEMISPRLLVRASSNTIFIEYNDADDATNVMTGDVVVKISGLTNPSMDGLLSQAVTVTQGGFAPTSESLTITKAAVDEDVTLSPDNKADAPVSITIDAKTASIIRGGSDINVTLTGFSIPDEGIDESDVLIYSSGTAGTNQTALNGFPAIVSVGAANKVTLSLPVQVGALDPKEAVIPAGDYRIIFKPSAGLKNPNASGAAKATVTVSDGDSVDQKKSFDIVSHISIPAASLWVERGTAVEVTGKGINSAGTATIHLYNSNGGPVRSTETGNTIASRNLQVLGTARMDGGTAVVEIDTSSSNLIADAVNAVADDPRTTDVDEAKNATGINRIVMVDAGGNIIGDALVGIKPTVTLDVTEVRRSGKMLVTASDWYYGNAISDIRVNGIQVQLPDSATDNDTIAERWTSQPVPAPGRPLTVIVPREVRLGTMEVVVQGTTQVKQGTAGSYDKHVQTVDVAVFDLTVNPSTAVSDQVVRIEGTGFVANSCIVSITVGEQAIRQATSRDPVGTASNCVDTDSNGKVADTFNIPLGLKPGTYRLVVRDAGNRVGETDLVIPKPAIELDPAMGQRGDTVTVIGSNFAADDLVTIRYNYGTTSIPVESVITDTVGKWRATFTVPITAPIGAKHEVVATSVNKGDGSTGADGVTRATLSAKAEHEVPDETLDLSPETVAAGGRLTVKGGNLPLFTPVSIYIGGIAAAGKAIGDDDASDGTGRYEKVLLVPQLQPGTHTVELVSHARNEDISVSRFVDIAAIVTRPTDEVFADLIDDGTLVVVWKYDNRTGMWASFDPSAPAELNDLALVSTDDIVWVETTENYEFQGTSYLAGWNLYSLE